MAITIVYGNPGVGKGVYMTATALGYMDDSQQALDCLHSSQGQIDRLYKQGLSAYMQLDTVVYADYPITNQLGIDRQLNSYFIDGFRLGFANNDVQVSYVPPNCKIFLNEAQKYYNSRMSKYFPDWASRYYEQHRHYGLDIWLDCQRPGLIDVNIRDIATSFIHVQETVFKYDNIGNIIQSGTHYIEYGSWQDAEHKSNGQEKAFAFNGNVFNSFDSYSNFNNFLPRAGQNYIQGKPVALDNKKADVELSEEMYRQLAPPGFYKKR